MRPPKFPLDRTKTYGHYRGLRLFHEASWSLRYRFNRKKWVEALGTQDSQLAWAEYMKVAKELSDGITPQEILGGRHHTTMTVAEAGKLCCANYTTISLGTRRNLLGALSRWVIGEDFDPSTGTWTRRADAAIVRPFGVLEVHTVETRDVRDLLRRVRRTENRFGRLNGQPYAKLVLAAVSTLFSWLISESMLKSKDGRVLANPAAKCNRFTFDPELDTKRKPDSDGEQATVGDDVKVFEPEQQAALTEWFRVYRRDLYPMLLCGLEAGLRFGEASALEIADYDRARHRLHVRKHVTADGVIEGTKSNRVGRGVIKKRSVPSNLGPLLEVALDARITALRVSPPPGWDGRRLFFARPSTHPDYQGRLNYLRPSNFYQSAWDRACETLGIKNLSFHATRHTFASTALAKGATPQEVAGWLGDTLQVVYQTYLHTIKGLERDHAGLLTPKREQPSSSKTRTRASLGVVRRG